MNISLFLLNNYQSIIIYVLIFIVFYLFVRWLKNKKQKHNNTFSSEINMPANIWFYSKLLDFELNIILVNGQNLENYFFFFLKKKYKIYEYELKTANLFDLVKEREIDQNYLEFYGEIYNRIQELKDSSPMDIINYIKEIKSYFNQDDLSVWLENRKTDDCNDC